MPQLHLYVSDDVAEKLRDRARARGLSLSKYLAELVTDRSKDEWQAEFFQRVVGGWAGEELERPPQGEYESRDLLL